MSDKKVTVSKQSLEGGGHLYSIWILGALGSPDEYLEAFTVLDAAGPDDVVAFRLNTSGGYVSTAMGLMNQVLGTEATTVSVAEGDVYSAGFDLFLITQHQVIAPLTDFMVHDSSSNVSTNTGNMYNYSAQAKKMMDEVFQCCYHKAINKAEYKQVCRGEDLYFTGSEMKARLQKFNNQTVTSSLHEFLDVVLDDGVEVVTSNGGADADNLASALAEYEALSNRMKELGIDD